MKNKFVGIFISIMLLMNAVIVIFPENLKVGASPGGDKDGEEDGTSLNNSYIWNRLKDFTNVVYLAYNETDIPKGRAFGSKGGLYTVNHILIPEMDVNLSLEDVHTEQIKNIPGIKKNYTSIIDVNDFQLTVNNNNYPFPNPIPVQESFVIPSGWPHIPWNEGGSLTHNYNLTDVKIYPLLINALFPLGGSYNNFSYNISSFTTLNNKSPFIVGNVTYIGANETVPEGNDQLGRVFLFDDTEECSDKIDNLTLAEGCILIDQGTDGVSNDTSSKC